MSKNKSKFTVFAAKFVGSIRGNSKDLKSGIHYQRGDGVHDLFRPLERAGASQLQRRLGLEQHVGLSAELVLASGLEKREGVVDCRDTERC